MAALGDDWRRSGSGSGHGQWRACGKGVRVQPGLSGAVDVAAPGLGAADGGGGSDRQEAGSLVVGREEDEVLEKARPSFIL